MLIETNWYGMTIKKVMEQLETSAHPVARSLHKGQHFNVLVIGFKKGMRLEAHKAGRTSRLTIIQGSVLYHAGEQRVQLNLFDEWEITVNEMHTVEAIEDSICLLTQGDH